MALERQTIPAQGSNRGPKLIPEWRFDLTGLPPRQRVDAWFEACSGFYDVTMDVDMLSRHDATFRWHRLDNLIVTSGVSSPFGARRNSRHVRHQTSFVRIFFSGQAGSLALIGEQCFDLGANAIHLLDYSRPFTLLRTQSAELNSVHLAHEAIGYDPSRHPPYMCIGEETPVGQVLAGAFFALKGQLPVLEMSEAPALASGMTDLVRALMLRDLESERGLAVVRSARHQAMRAFIERHLHEPLPPVESLCRKFAVSRATVYRDFEAEGGIANYVMNLRLERALVDLLDCGPTRGAVTAISERWGFESLSHFSHRFRERFGLAPSAFAGLGGTALRTDGSAAQSARIDTSCLDRRSSLSSWFFSEA